MLPDLRFPARWLVEQVGLLGLRRVRDRRVVAAATHPPHHLPHGGVDSRPLPQELRSGLPEKDHLQIQA